MRDRLDVEMRIVVTEGILSREDAAALRQEALQTRQSPLALLVKQGCPTRRADRSWAWRSRTPRSAAPIRSRSPRPIRCREAHAAEVPRFPVAGWDRYVSVRFLGQGGMGQVFLAVDPRLYREVAIKFVRGDNPEHVRRLIAEARAQARVSHERVCKVHEVGEVEGKVYIAMQHIDGKPLGALAGELTLEQKVMLVRGAAEGLQEAHRAGIIHRDVKPSNIMVERAEDGALRPYVMDFGHLEPAMTAVPSGSICSVRRRSIPRRIGSAAG